jgi:hypothetical protein
MENTIQNRNTTRNIIRNAFVTLLLLLVPLLGMQFSDEVDWTLADFVIMGVLIFGLSTAYELVTRKMSKEKRIIFGAIFLVVFLLIWAELAVGIFGSPLAGF